MNAEQTKGPRPVLVVLDEVAAFQDPTEVAPASLVHNVTPDGRVMHSMSKVDGVWACACGERRDRFGNTL